MDNRAQRWTYWRGTNAASGDLTTATSSVTSATTYGGVSRADHRGGVGRIPSTTAYTTARIWTETEERQQQTSERPQPAIYVESDRETTIEAVAAKVGAGV